MRLALWLKVYQILLILLECLKKNYLPCHKFHPEAGNVNCISVLKALVMGKNCFLLHVTHATLFILTDWFSSYGVSLQWTLPFGNYKTVISSFPIIILLFYLLSFYWVAILQTDLMNTIQIIKSYIPN